MIELWWRQDANADWELIDTPVSAEAARILLEYKLAFGGLGSWKIKDTDSDADEWLG